LTKFLFIVSKIRSDSFWGRCAVGCEMLVRHIRVGADYSQKMGFIWSK